MSFPAFFGTKAVHGSRLNDFILELVDRGLFRPKEGFTVQPASDLTIMRQQGRVPEPVGGGV